MIDTKAALEKFREWWFAEEQAELRLNFAEGWGFRVWLASLAAIEIELKDAYLDADKGKIVLSLTSVINEIASHGIRIKGKTE